ncbi:hypothetical protein PFISCL1PPCAC_22759, partial [Pristionchus fissidentatus]
PLCFVVLSLPFLSPFPPRSPSISTSHLSEEWLPQRPHDEAMANVCNKNQKRKLTPRQSYKQLGTMLADLTLYTSNACDDNFEEEQFKRNQPDVKSLSEMIAENDTERTLNATSCYLRLMDSDYEKSFIFVPHGVPNTLKNEKPDEKRRSKTIPLKDDTSSASSAQNVSDGESRSPVKQKKQKNRKSDASYDRPSAAPSHMTVLGTNDRPSA